MYSSIYSFSNYDIIDFFNRLGVKTKEERGKRIFPVSDNAKDVRDGVIAYKIAAHAADVALGKPKARDRDDAISDARAEFNWEKQFGLALDPDKAREFRKEAIAEQNESSGENNDHDNYCTMCGPNYCSMRISQEIKEDSD